MPQLHLYVPDSIAEQIRQRAENRGLSISKFLAELVQSEIETGWPDSFFTQIVGGWQGNPLERGEQGNPDSREAF
jgi:hypothetical protein